MRAQADPVADMEFEARTLGEADEHDARQQRARHHVEAIDRVLESLGYAGPIKLTVRTPRIVLFYRNELRRFLIEQLREHGPQTSRQLAVRLVQLEGKDHRDRQMMNDVVKRMGKALRTMVTLRIATRSPAKIKGEFIWEVSKIRD